MTKRLQGRVAIVNGGGSSGPGWGNGKCTAVQFAREGAKVVVVDINRAAAEETAARLGLIQVNDGGAIDAAIDSLIAQNPKSLQDFKAGKQAALGALVGMVMKSGKGLNPKLVQERLKKRIS